MKVQVWVLLILLYIAVLPACENKNVTGNSDISLTASVVYQDSSQVILLCDHEWNNIVISKEDPLKYVEGTSFVIPDRKTARILHSLQVKAGSQRYLCMENGTYYTFCFNNQGQIVQAGSKTKYALRPVRVVAVPKDTIIKL